MIDRLAEVLRRCRAASPHRSAARSAFFQFARSGGQAELERAAEVLQHAEPVAKAGAVALVDHHQIEEIRVVVLVELLAVQLFIEVLVVGEEDLADQMLPLGDGLLVDGDALIGREGGRRHGRPDP